MYVTLNNHPKRESVVQRKEILRQIIIPFYPERPKDRPKVAQNYLLIQGVVCLSYMLIKLINDILNMTSYNRDRFLLPVTIAL